MVTGRVDLKFNPFTSTNVLVHHSGTWSMNVATHFSPSVRYRLCTHPDICFAQTVSFWHLFETDYINTAFPLILSLASLTNFLLPQPVSALSFHHHIGPPVMLYTNFIIIW
jgi:hypothetical protein